MRLCLCFVVIVQRLLDRRFSWDNWNVASSWTVYGILFLKGASLTTIEVISDCTVAFACKSWFSSGGSLLLVEQVYLILCIWIIRISIRRLLICLRIRCDWIRCTSHILVGHRASSLILFCSFTEATPSASESRSWAIGCSLAKSSLVFSRFWTLALILSISLVIVRRLCLKAIASGSFRSIEPICLLMSKMRCILRFFRTIRLASSEGIWPGLFFFFSWFLAQLIVLSWNLRFELRWWCFLADFVCSRSCVLEEVRSNSHMSCCSKIAPWEDILAWSYLPFEIRVEYFAKLYLFAFFPNFLERQKWSCWFIFIFLPAWWWWKPVCRYI